MKKLFISILFFGLLLVTKVNAQSAIGGGLLLADPIAIEAKADFNVTDRISISPYFNYFIGNSNSGNYENVSYKAGPDFIIGADGHYNLGEPESFNYYPLIGLQYGSYSASGSVGEYSSSVSSSGIGFNIGGGATYALSNNMKIYGELKYNYFIGVGLSAGILFSL